MRARTHTARGDTKSTATRVRARAKEADIIGSLKPDESMAILRALLERHPKLRGEAEAIGRVAITSVKAEAIADELEEAILGLDLDDLDGRAGRHSWGYVEPTEAAWEILQETIEPFMKDLMRHVDLGFEASAVATCEGIVRGLYRLRRKDADGILGYAEDFPVEAAGDAVSALAKKSAAQHRRRWKPSDQLVQDVPEWASMIERCIRTNR